MEDNKPIETLSLQEIEKRLRAEIVSLYRVNQALRAEIAKEQHEEGTLRNSEEEIKVLMNYANEAAFFIQKLGFEIQGIHNIGFEKLTLVQAFIHDLKGPLALISSCAQFCMDNSDLNSPEKENLRIIYESSQRANTLIRKFFELFEEPKILREPIQINEIIIRAWEIVQYDTQAMHVSFKADLEKELPEILGSFEELERVFYNLFLNAIQAVNKNGTVFVKTALCSKRMIEAQIMDDGPGIRPEYLSRIFEPFFTTKEEGTGLGLAICLSIVHQHNGTIQAAKTKKGAKISVKLPARE